MDQIKAKFQVGSVIATLGDQESVSMYGVYGETNQEDNTYSAATPSAQCGLLVSNPDAKGFFKQGKKYYAVFTEAQD